jgi:hypothetical protein
LSEREPQPPTRTPQPAEARRELGSVGPSRSESAAVAVAQAQLMDAIAEAEAAANAILERSAAWLVLHPVKHRRLRRECERATDELLARRHHWRMLRAA